MLHDGNAKADWSAQIGADLKEGQFAEIMATRSVVVRRQEVINAVM